MLAHDKRNPETYDTTAEDHAADAIVYACLSRPWAPAKPIKYKLKNKYNKERKPLSVRIVVKEVNMFCGII